MDGGRVLRALLASGWGCARHPDRGPIGQVGALLLGLWGLGFFADWGLPARRAGPHRALRLLGAGAEAAAVETRAAGQGLR